MLKSEAFASEVNLRQRRVVLVRRRAARRADVQLVEGEGAKVEVGQLRHHLAHVHAQRGRLSSLWRWAASSTSSSPSSSPISFLQPSLFSFRLFTPRPLPLILHPQLLGVAGVKQRGVNLHLPLAVLEAKGALS